MIHGICRFSNRSPASGGAARFPVTADDSSSTTECVRAAAAVATGGPPVPGRRIPAVTTAYVAVPCGFDDDLINLATRWPSGVRLSITRLLVACDHASPAQ